MVNLLIGILKIAYIMLEKLYNYKKIRLPDKWLALKRMVAGSTGPKFAKTKKPSTTREYPIGCIPNSV
jgi:hypothetical protein